MTYQALQPLSHNRSETSFAGQLRNEEDVLGCRDLVGAVSATCVRVMKNSKVSCLWVCGNNVLLYGKLTLVEILSCHY